MWSGLPYSPIFCLFTGSGVCGRNQGYMEGFKSYGWNRLAACSCFGWWYETVGEDGHVCGNKHIF